MSRAAYLDLQIPVALKSFNWVTWKLIVETWIETLRCLFLFDYMPLANVVQWCKNVCWDGDSFHTKTFKDLSFVQAENYFLAYYLTPVVVVVVVVGVVVAKERPAVLFVLNCLVKGTQHATIFVSKMHFVTLWYGLLGVNFTNMCTHDLVPNSSIGDK